MKLHKHALIICGTIMIVFVALSLLIPFARTEVFWIAFGSGVLLLTILALFFPKVFDKGNDEFSKVLLWPILKVAYIAMIAQICISFLLMLLARICPVWVAWVIEILVFAFILLAITTKDAARIAVTQAEIKLEDKTKSWRAIMARAETIAVTTSNPEMKRIAEGIRYADPMPSALDSQISDILESISDNADNESIQQLKKLLAERAIAAKLAKKGMLQ